MEDIMQGFGGKMKGGSYEMVWLYEMQYEN